MMIMIGKCLVRSRERTCEQSLSPGMFEAEAHDQEVVIALRQAQKRARGVGLPLNVMLVLERLDDPLGGTVAILDKQNAPSPAELIELHAERGSKAHLLLGRGAHQG